MKTTTKLHWLIDIAITALFIYLHFDIKHTIQSNTSEAAFWKDVATKCIELNP